MSYQYVHIDFETFSKRDIKSCGAYEYAADSSTEIICMMWKWRHEGRRAYGYGKLPRVTAIDSVKCLTKTGKPKTVKVKQYETIEYGQRNLETLFGQLFDESGNFRDDVKICAWNIQFERAVWQFVGHRQLGWPSLEPFGITPWEDTMAIGKAHTLPGALEDAAKALGVVEQKDTSGKKAMLRISQPKKTSQVDPYERDYDPTKWKTCTKYCRQDVYTDANIATKLLPLSKIGPIEQDVWELDQEMNHHGVLIDRETVVPTLRIIEDADARLNQEFASIVGAPEITISKHAPFKKWLSQNGIETDSVARGELESILEQKELPENVRSAIEIKLTGSKSSVKKFYRMEDASRYDSYARYLCQYYGASTGRWAGRLIQLQNLIKGKAFAGFLDAAKVDGRKTDMQFLCDLLSDSLRTGDYDCVNLLWGNPVEAASTGLRSMIIADPGQVLIFSDYASIEARGLGWLSGEKIMLDIFHQGLCLYKDMAGQIYELSDPQSMEKKDYRRDLGKVAILGLGYQMGGPNFERTCRSSGIDMTLDFANEIVSTYRGRYAEVPATWYELNSAAIDAIRNPGRDSYARRCSFYKKTDKGSPLYCELPSGRRLIYFAAEVRRVSTQWGPRDAVFYQGIDSQKPGRNWDWVSTYGGKWTENIVQAISRDVMAEAMLQLKRNGYSLNFTVHDEIVASQAVTDGCPVDVTAIEQIMCEVPAWAKGFPIEAEAEFGTRYRK